MYGILEQTLWCLLASYQANVLRRWHLLPQQSVPSTSSQIIFFKTYFSDMSNELPRVESLLIELLALLFLNRVALLHIAITNDGSFKLGFLCSPHSWTLHEQLANTMTTMRMATLGLRFVILGLKTSWIFCFFLIISLVKELLVACNI